MRRGSRTSDARRGTSTSGAPSPATRSSATSTRWTRSSPHGVAPNRIGRARKSGILRYGQLWCQPFDHLGAVDEDIPERQPLRRRRILGDLGPEAGRNAYYKPARQLEILGTGRNRK